jgi:hypothetical protein
MNDLGVVLGMVSNDEITNKEWRHSFAEFFGFLDDGDEETGTALVTAQVKKGWGRSQLLIRRGEAYKNLPLICLIPVKQFSQKRNFRQEHQ